MRYETKWMHLVLPYYRKRMDKQKDLGKKVGVVMVVTREGGGGWGWWVKKRERKLWEKCKQLSLMSHSAEIPARGGETVSEIARERGWNNECQVGERANMRRKQKTLWEQEEIQESVN